MASLSRHSYETTDLAVEGLFIVGPGELWTPEYNTSVVLDHNGMPGDKHSGPTRTIKTFESPDLAGLEVINDRQLSIVDSQDMHVIADGLELPADDIEEATLLPVEQFLAGQLAANILLRSSVGDNLNSVAAPGTVLVFGRGEEASSASIRLTEYNPPCSKPMRKLSETLTALGIESRLSTPELSERFKEVARARRGWLGSVYSVGKLARGQSVSVYKTLDIPSAK